MDLRRPVLAVLVGGTPAPGVNGVITSAVLEAINRGCNVIGIKDGFARVKRGETQGAVHRFTAVDVTRLYSIGGSFLGTSRARLENTQEVDNVLRVLEHLRVRYLVTIGGTVTAYSASLVASAAKAAKFDLSLVHVPKSIFNDLPLPPYTQTFGFATARDEGVRIVRNLKQDARAMTRWYVIVVMGQKAGHLALGIGKAAAATLTLIPEEYKDKPVKFDEVCDVVEAAMIKRLAVEKGYGVAVLTEGLVDLMDSKELTSMFTDSDNGHQQLGRQVCTELRRRWTERGYPVTLVSRNLGNELRSANPNATDVDLSRDLGYGAVKFLMQGGTGCMVALESGKVSAIPLSKILDSQTGRTQIRLIDTQSLQYEVAQRYMIKLLKTDLQNVEMLAKLCRVAGMSQPDFISRYEHVAQDSPQ